MFNKEKHKKKIEEQSKADRLVKALPVATTGANLYLSKKVMPKVNPADLSPAEMTGIVRNFNKKHNTNITVSPAKGPGSSVTFPRNAKIPTNEARKAMMKMRFGNDIFDQIEGAKKNNSSLVKSFNNEAVLLHELGHAKNLDKNKTGLLKAQKALDIAQVPLLTKTVRKGIRRLDGDNKNGLANKSMDFLENNPEVVLGVSKLPRLLEEGRASAYATKQLVSKYGLKPGLKKAVPLAAGLGTYGLSSLAPVVVGGHYIRKTKTKTDKE